MNTSEPFTPPPETSDTGDAMHAYAKVWPHVQVAVEYTVRDLTKNREHREELIQAARLKFWLVDPSRCNIQSQHDLFVLRSVLAKHVRRFAAKRRREDATWLDSVPKDLLQELL
jgi:hypothetical protein